MSCIENEIILENLYEKYLDLGYDEDMASELAFEEFANLQWNLNFHGLKKLLRLITHRSWKIAQELAWAFF